MRVDFNAAEVRRLIDMWRNNVDLQSPMTDELKITFMVRRRKLLDSYVDISAVLLQMMEQMTPLDDRIELEETTEAIRELGVWAQNGLIEIERMSQ